MSYIIKNLSFEFHQFICQLGVEFKSSLDTFGLPLKKEYLRLLFSSYRMTQLEDYDCEKNIIKVLQIKSEIQFLLNEIERLEIKNNSNLYLKKLGDLAHINKD